MARVFYLMRAVVLGPVARHGPNLLFQVELMPAHAGHFVATLGSEQQKLEKGPEWPADFVAARPEPPQLVIAQHAIPGALFRRRLHAIHRRDRKAVLLDRPIEQRPEAPQCPVGLNLGLACDSVGLSRCFGQRYPGAAV